MNRLLITMKSGDRHLITSSHTSVVDFIKEILPKKANEDLWTVFKLATNDEYGNDMILFNGLEVESVKCLGQ